MNRLGAEEAAGARIVVRQAVETDILHRVAAEDAHADFAAVHLPEMLQIGVDIRHHQRVVIINKVGHRGKVGLDDIHAAILRLLQTGNRVAQRAVVVHLNLDSAVRAFLHLLGEPLARLRRHVAIRLVVGETEGNRIVGHRRAEPEHHHHRRRNGDHSFFHVLLPFIILRYIRRPPGSWRR